MKASRDSLWIMGTMAVIAWGVTAYTYINTGFSIAIIAFALFVIGERYRGRSWPVLSIDRELAAAFVILYGALFFTTAFHLDHWENLYGGYYCAAAFLLYTLPFWMALYMGRRYDVRKAVIYTFYAVLNVMCLYGIVKYFWLGEYRLTSFYGPGTRVAMMMDMFFPFTVAAAVYYRKNRLFLAVSSVLIVLEIAVLILGKVRGTYLALSAALLVTFLAGMILEHSRLSRRVKRYMWAGTFAGILLMAVYGISLGWGNMHRMLGEERFLFWESSYHMWLDHPLMGIGLDEWQSLWADSEYTHPDAKEHGAVHPHNVFIYFFATAGSIGGAAYVAYCVLLFRYLFRKVRQNDRNPFNWAMLFLFTAVTAHGLVDQSFILKLTGRIFYFMLGYSLIFDEWMKRKPDLPGKDSAGAKGGES